MPLFTTIGAALFGAGTFLAGATAFALQMAAGIGLNLIAAAIKGKPTQEKVGIQGKMTAGGDVARSVLMGLYNTAGSLVYHNTYGQSGETPNAFYVEVRALADFPVGSLVDVWVDGEKVTLINGDYGLTSTKHIKYGTKWGDLQHLWFQFYDGTQTTADSRLVSWFGGSDRPYGSDRIGKGVPYVIITALRDDLETENPLFNGFPQCKFTLAGTKLYDPSKDSTAGGDGDQRYSDPSTWGGDGDNLPAVQIYNILRGITYNDAWLYGLQAANPAILPPANWIAAINKCRAAVDGPDGAEAQYRSGAQIDVNIAPADAIESLLKTCNGRLTEVGGVYTIHVGEPDTPVLSFSDADILSSEEQVYNPFRSLADSINGVVAKYPEPLEGWNVKTSPTQENPAQQVRDGGRKLFADVDLSACPYHGQVQRLLKSAMLEALRERRHTIVLPPWAQCLEPGDIVQWDSARNGYEDKWFRIDGMAYKANLDVMLQVTEVDPADYDWSQDDDYIAPVFAPMEIIRPAPQPMVSWYAEGQILTDAAGLPRRPVVYLEWDGSKEDISGVSYEIAKTASDADIFLRGSTDDAQRGSIIVSSQAFLPATTIYARGRYIPASPRDMLWSDWLPAILPDVRLGLVEFQEAIKYQVTQALDDLDNTRAQLEHLIASVASVDIARNWLDKKQQRRELAAFSGKATAEITELWTAATDLEASLAQTELDLSTEIDQANSRITITNTSLSDLTQSVADQKQSFESQFGTVNSSLTTEIQARSTADGALSTRIDRLDSSVFNPETGLSATSNVALSLQSQVSSPTNGLATKASAVALLDLKSQIDNPATGLNAVASVTNGLYTQVNSPTNGLATKASAGFVQTLQTTLNNHTATLDTIAGSVDGSRVQWGLLATFSGAPSGGLVFTGVRTESGAYYNFAFRGDVIVDGTISGAKIQAGSINALQLSINSVGIDQIIANAVTNTKDFAHDGGTYSLGTVLVAGDVDIRSGRAQVEYSGSWQTLSFSGGTIEQVAVVGLSLYVNDMFVEKFTWYCEMSDRDNDRGRFRLRVPIFIKSVVSNLGAGSNNFQIRIASSSELIGLGFPQPVACGAGRMFVNNFRNG